MNIIMEPEKAIWESIVSRPEYAVKDLDDLVNDMFSEIQKRGDDAVRNYTALFDGISVKEIQVTEAEIQNAVSQVPDKLKQAIQQAKMNIESFHSAQLSKNSRVETVPGVNCWTERRPIEKVGIYIPSGTAPLFSTILMLAIPARLAGCETIVMCTPPKENNLIDPVMLYAAKLCGISIICKVGGIQSIAAMALGTKSVPKVYKIYGPGNQFVTAAKQMATRYKTAIDMPAGPSELLVYADDTAKPAFVASDLLSQAEHGVDSQVILLSPSKKLLDRVIIELSAQLQSLPRKSIVEKALNHSRFIQIKNRSTAIEFINEYAPEHCIVISEDEQFILENIRNAGSVFIGNYTPESAGDYASGTNHTLPTNGFAKQYSGVNLDSFTKQITFQKISKLGIQNIGNIVELMAEAEGLQAHKNAVTIRLNDIRNER
ncbi:histidinol dehydrogenase [Constantimarinum furrinae]|nr:histidinol dehydrogenase [Constantimarinum furrinae]